MKIQFTLITFLISSVLISQPAIQWKNNFGGSGSESLNSIIHTFDDGYILAGNSNSNDFNVTGQHGDYDAWIVKLNNFGLTEWKYCYGGTAYENALSILQTADSGYFVIGTSNSNDGNVTGNHGSYDCWVFKLDQHGTLQWQKSYGGSNFDSGKDAFQTADGGFMIVGNSDSNDGDVSGAHGNDDVWILKIDVSGNLEWQKCFGGSAADIGKKIRRTSDQNYIVCSGSNSSDGDISGVNGGSDFWIFKMDSLGNLLWEQSYGGSNDEIPGDINETTDHGFLIGGLTQSQNGDVSGNHGYTDGWLVKTDSTGNLQLQNCFGGSSYEEIPALKLTNDGGCIIAGHAQSYNGDVTGQHGNGDAWFIKSDSAGTIEWQRCLGGSLTEYGRSILQTSDGGFLLGAISSSSDGDLTANYGEQDYWVVKFEQPNSIAKNENINDINIFPNPSYGSFTINIPKEHSVIRLEIINSIGEIIYSDNSYFNGKVINQNFSRGIYLVNVETNTGWMKKKMVIN